jgi:succinate dehydrogenase flavin-adding protein (antitoxin of CptAB toxin-antitoxin module)
MLCSAPAFDRDSQGGSVDDLLKALAANIGAIIAGIAAMITALGGCVTVVIACYLAQANRHKLDAETLRLKNEARKLDLEVDLSMDQRAANMYDRLDKLENDRYTLRGLLTERDGQIFDLKLEMGQLKARGLKRDEEYAAVERRLQECEAKWHRVETTEVMVQIVKPESAEATS